MKLDSHLHNIIAQFAAADGDLPEMHRLQHAAMTHIQKRAPYMSQRDVTRLWDILIDALTIED